VGEEVLRQLGDLAKSEARGVVPADGEHLPSWASSSDCSTGHRGFNPPESCREAPGMAVPPPSCEVCLIHSLLLHQLVNSSWSSHYSL
jgi:hypothetical protein